METLQCVPAFLSTRRKSNPFQSVITIQPAQPAAPANVSRDQISLLPNRGMLRPHSMLDHKTSSAPPSCRAELPESDPETIHAQSNPRQQPEHLPRPAYRRYVLPLEGDPHEPAEQ